MELSNLEESRNANSRIQAIPELRPPRVTTILILKLKDVIDKMLYFLEFLG